MNTIDVLKDILDDLQLGKDWGVSQVLIDASDEKIAALTNAIEQLEWVPVSGGLPKYTNDYNVVCVIGSMLGCFETVRTYRFEAIRGQQPCWIVPDKYDEIVKITHWRRLPQPPAKDGE